MSSDEQSCSGGENDENATINVCQPGLSVFQLHNALRYFTKETILREELADVNIELYLDDDNTILAIEQIFQRKWHRVQQSSNCNSEGSSGSCSFFNVISELSEKPEKVNSENGRETPNSDTLSAFDRRGRHSQVFSLDALFRLMSILPKPIASICKQIMDRDNLKWKISLYDIILVFLNWGATLRSLDLEDLIDSSQVFTPKLISPYSNDRNCDAVFPDPANVCLVLSALIQRLPTDSFEPTSMKIVFVKALVFAALDSQHKHNTSLYCRSITSFLDSFHPWNEALARSLVDSLGLNHMNIQNAEFVSCCLFSMLTERQNMTGMHACHALLHYRFGLPNQPCFSSVISQLILPPHLLDRFSLVEIYTMTQLLHILLIRHTMQIPPCSQDTVERLCYWTIQVRSTLIQPPHGLHLLSTYLRERLGRLSSECRSIIHRIYKRNTSKTLTEEILSQK